MNNINKTTEQQIDEAVESVKAYLIMQANNSQQTENIIRQLDSFGHELKAMSALFNDNNAFKAFIHMMLSKIRQDII